MTYYRIGPHRTMSDHVCKREIEAKPKSAGNRAVIKSYRAAYALSSLTSEV